MPLRTFTETGVRDWQAIESVMPLTSCAQAFTVAADCAFSRVSADAMRQAMATSAEHLAAAQAWSERFSWGAMAGVVREALSGTSGASPAL